MLWARELFIKEGTCSFDDDLEFFHWGGGLFDFLDSFFYGGQDFLNVEGFEWVGNFSEGGN